MVVPGRGKSQKPAGQKELRKVVLVSRSVVEGAGGLDTDHVLFDESFGSLDSLPASGRSLVERVSGTGGTELLNDVLQSAAGNFSDAVGISAQDESGIYVSAGSASLFPDLGLAGLDKSYARDLSDLVLVDVVGVYVLVRILPVGIAHEVVLTVRMDDTGIVAVDSRSVHNSEVSYGHSDSLYGEVVVIGSGSTAAYEGVSGRYLAFSILNVGAAVEYFSNNGIENPASLGSEELGSLDEVVVDSSQKEYVGKLDVVAVLSYSRGEVGYVELLAGRGNAFSQRSERLSERAVLPELDGLAAILRNGMLLAELVVHELRLSEIDEIIAVIGFHFHGQVLAGAGLRGDVGIVEKVEIYSVKIVEHGVIPSCAVRTRSSLLLPRVLRSQLCPFW